MARRAQENVEGGWRKGCWSVELVGEEGEESVEAGTNKGQRRVWGGVEDPPVGDQRNCRTPSILTEERLSLLSLMSLQSSP